MRNLLALVAINVGLAAVNLLTPSAAYANSDDFRNCCKKSVEETYFCCTNCCWSPFGPDECTSSSECNPGGGGGEDSPGLE